MLRIRVIAVLAVSVALATPLIASGADGSPFTRGMAMLQEELDLLDQVAPRNATDPQFAANRRRLEYVDGEGATVLDQIRAGGIDPSATLVRTLGRLPVPVAGVMPPARSDYATAVDELRRLDARYRSDPRFTSAGASRAGGSPLPIVLAAILGAAVALLTAVRFMRRRGNGSRDLIAIAMTDALTGVANRRKLDDDVAETAGGPPTSGVGVLMIDVDHFKRVNDEHGHAVGDEVLRRVARALVGNLRSGARVYRYGGEEFCVVLTAATLGEARAVAERLREAVARAAMPAGLAMSVSVGVARGVSREIAATMTRADEALYAAKRAGRDRVEVAAGSRPRTDQPGAEPSRFTTRGPAPTR